MSRRLRARGRTVPGPGFRCRGGSGRPGIPGGGAAGRRGRLWSRSSIGSSAGRFTECAYPGPAAPARRERSGRTSEKPGIVGVYGTDVITAGKVARADQMRTTGVHVYRNRAAGRVLATLATTLATVGEFAVLTGGPGPAGAEPRASGAALQTFPLVAGDVRAAGAVLPARATGPFSLLGVTWADPRVAV